MHTITIAKLKATLSAELKRVRAGETVTVLDRSTPVAQLSPIPDAIKVTQPAEEPYRFRKLSPLTTRDPLEFLEMERDEKW